MQPLSPEERSGLTRERLVDAAVGLITEEGLDALSMRALADRLQVKAASLYWHVRDRRELLELVAEGLLEAVPRVRHRASWRETVQAIADGLRRTVTAHHDANRVLLEVPEALARSDVARDLSSVLAAAGLRDSEAADVARVVMTQVIAAPMPTTREEGDVRSGGEPAWLWLDSGSRGVILRAGTADMQGLIRVPPDQAGAAPAVIRGERVVVRRLRGVGRGELELNPRRPWKFKVQAPTWNTVLDLAGIDVREIWVDSGAANIDVSLSPPRGVVPIHVSSGVVDVAIHRPREAAVVATVHAGAVKFRLDGASSKVAVTDVQWQSPGALGAPSRYELDVSGGVVKLDLDVYVPARRPVETAAPAPESAGKPATALDILLDGVEARVKTRS